MKTLSVAPSHKKSATAKALNGWVPLLLLPILVLSLFPSSWPRWGFMWTLAFSIYCGCKWLTFRQCQTSHVPLWQRLAYLLAWPGMNAEEFFCGPSLRDSERPTAIDWAIAIMQTTAGMAVLYALVRLIPANLAYLQGWLGMFGLVMVLHFGCFRLLWCFWRSLGFPVQPLMDHPASSTSLSEFWGRRWNIAFRDLTHRFLFRPLQRRLGPHPALLIGFLVSGMVHDLVISLPAQGGYGLPTLFFSLQCLGILFERSVIGKRLGLGHGWFGWLFCLLLLAGPAALLFHVPFVDHVVLPFLQVIGVPSHA